MARHPTYVPLQVVLNNRKVGVLKRQSNGALEFLYEDSWLGWENAIPVSLSLPLRQGRITGPEVSAFFENLLPDNPDIRSRIAEKTRAGGTDAYSMLHAIGRDCVGALQFLEVFEEADKAGTVSGAVLNEQKIAAIIRGLSGNPLGIYEDDEFRISLAGAQEKTALLYWKKKWHIPKGTTATTHILKPQIGTTREGIDLTQSVENEFLCMKLTKALGLPTAEVAIEVFEDQSVLVVERFDRLWTKDKRLLRLPQEDCLQALGLPPSMKYENRAEPGAKAGIRDILELLKGADEPLKDQKTFLKAQIVFWLLAATDGHAKNFSLMLAPGGRFRLAPLYDVLSARHAIDRGQIRKNRATLAMCVGTGRHYRIDEVVPRHFVETAKLCGVAADVVPGIFEELARDGARAADDVLKNLPPRFPKNLATSIVNGFKQRLRFLSE
ncbi:MAG: type II toxin-antitoxin system HipA family toxin [Rhodospirillales bacterium]|nr:type II toxin-antitoxin system HipA family toxin [Rhodospirillales bacterium]